jgi:Na+-transporting methylmalonyl-CoA/oxaloacetate decarboxylase gamma subunit
MSEALLIALQITLVGMGLVFAMICALWGGMALLVRLGAERERPAADAQPEAQPADAAPAADAQPLPADDREQRRKAAAIAVAVALAQQVAARPFRMPPTAGVSPWQAVARSNQLHQRGKIR